MGRCSHWTIILRFRAADGGHLGRRTKISTLPDIDTTQKDAYSLSRNLSIVDDAAMSQRHSTMQCEDLTQEQADAALGKIAADAPVLGAVEAADDIQRFSAR